GFLQENLDDGRETVGGAAGVGDDVVLRRIVLVFVHAENESDVFVRSRSRDDNFFNGRAKVRLGDGCVGEAAGGLNDDLCAHICPGQLGRILFCVDLDLLSVDRNEVVSCNDFVLEIAENRVVLEQVSQGGGAGQVVNGNKIELGIAEGGAQNVAANSAEAVDANLNCHAYSPSL